MRLGVRQYKNASRRENLNVGIQIRLPCFLFFWILIFFFQCNNKFFTSYTLVVKSHHSGTQGSKYTTVRTKRGRERKRVISQMKLKSNLPKLCHSFQNIENVRKQNNRFQNIDETKNLVSSFFLKTQNNVQISARS